MIDINESTLKKQKSTFVQRVLHKKVEKFIMRNRAGALATVSDRNIPHVATVYCFIDNDFNFYFSTRVESRKFNNITHNPIVALTFSNEISITTVQLTGAAERVENFKTEQDVLRELFAYRHGDPNWPMPPIKLFERNMTNELAVIKVVPNEMTYGSFAASKAGRYQPFFEKVI